MLFRIRLRQFSRVLTTGPRLTTVKPSFVAYGTYFAVVLRKTVSTTQHRAKFGEIAKEATSTALHGRAGNDAHGKKPNRQHARLCVTWESRAKGSSRFGCHDALLRFLLRQSSQSNARLRLGKRRSSRKSSKGKESYT